MDEGYDVINLGLLERAHIVVVPGIGFGSHGEGYVRIGLLTPEERLLGAIEKRLGLPHHAMHTLGKN